MSVMKVLVCGHSSFASQGPPALLRAAGYQVTCFGRGPVGSGSGDDGLTTVTGDADKIDMNPHLVDQEFDAVVNDAFAWTLNKTELRFAAHNFHSVLKTGGALIFTGADQWSQAEDRNTLIEPAWEAAPRFQL